MISVETGVTVQSVNVMTSNEGANKNSHTPSFTIEGYRTVVFEKIGVLKVPVFIFEDVNVES